MNTSLRIFANCISIEKTSQSSLLNILYSDFRMAAAIFILITLFVAYKATMGFSRIVDNINLGMDEEISGNETQRWKNVFLIALGQKKMFKMTIPALLHLVIYVSFVITQIELIEILIDGAFGTHRVFAPLLGGFYTFIISFIEILSLLTLVVTIAFLARRTVLKVERFQKPEMKGFPMIDGITILVFEMILITAIFTMNSSDIALQTLYPDHYHHTGFFAISGFLGPALFSKFDGHVLAGLERLGWWMHVLMVYGFMLYLPISKHLHIIFAFPNTYFGRVTPKGEIENMPEIMAEVKSMMGISSEPAPSDNPDYMPVFGASDVTSLSWKNILDAYSCTECGRCTMNCPANITGKKLSPRKVMMDVRDRADEVGLKIASGDIRLIKEELRSPEAVLDKTNFDDGKTLFDFITPEEIHACTTCNACVEACPVTINPLDIILKMRRHEILALSAGPAEWTPMFTSLENTGAVWQMPVDRDKWATELENA